MVGKIEDSELVSSDKLVNVVVAMPANVEFGGAIAEVEEKWMLLENEEVTFSCHGNGGTPAAEVFGFLGSDEAINEDDDIALDEASFEELTNFDDERLIDITKEFTFAPSREDCGKYLKCFARQSNDDGDLVFEDVPEISMQVKYRFIDVYNLVHPLFRLWLYTHPNLMRKSLPLASMKKPWNLLTLRWVW